MARRLTQFVAGARDVAPLLIGVGPSGVIVGITAISIGLTPVQTMGMSLLVMAGASQLAALDLLRTGAFWGTIILTVFIINLRLVIYSTALGPRFKGESLGWRCMLAYPLVDYTYLLSIARFDREPDMPMKRWYYLGAGLPIALVWNASTLLGILAGTQIPAAWSLDFAIPLACVAFIVSAVTDWSSVIAAVVGGLVAVFAYSLPVNMGLISATVAGVAAGYCAERAMRRDERGREVARDG